MRASLHVAPFLKDVLMLPIMHYVIAVETYLSPVETHCMNIDYFIPDEENQTRGFSDDAMARLRKYERRIITCNFSHTGRRKSAEGR